ncbi:MAG: hypothetical protein JNK82_42400 [Myxococcaceae bacterium]|nr:hypothetical protein [Myxococcaceae bacterium]
MRALLVVTLVLLSCKKAPGYEERSPDGGTLLEIDADCGQGALRIDGQPVEKGVPSAVTPGRHHVDCGPNGREVEVHDGQLFHFNYWGLGQ